MIGVVPKSQRVLYLLTMTRDGDIMRINTASLQILSYMRTHRNPVRTLGSAKHTNRMLLQAVSTTCRSSFELEDLPLSQTRFLSE